MDQNLILAYYANQAANRRHFQTLFFAVCGFTWSFALAVLVLTMNRPLALDIEDATGASGLVLTGGAFIAHRLLLRERSAFREMIAAWQAVQAREGAPTKAGFRPGAMTIACAVQGLIGLGFLGFAVGRKALPLMS